MANALTLISEQVLGSSAASVTFSSISASYRDLVIEFVGTLSTPEGIKLQFNSDTGTNYSTTYVQGTGSAANSGRNTNYTEGDIAYFDSTLSTIQATVFSYANTSVCKSVLSRASDAGLAVQAWATLWRSTAAINTIKIKGGGSSSFNAGTTVRLWGVS